MKHFGKGAGKRGSPIEKLVSGMQRVEMWKIAKLTIGGVGLQSTFWSKSDFAWMDGGQCGDDRRLVPEAPEALAVEIK